MGIFTKLVEKIHAMQKKHENKKAFSAALISAVRDGVLTSDEIDELNRQKSNYGLSEEDLTKIRITAYETAFSSAKADGRITEAEEAELANIQRYLGINDHDIANKRAELNRLRLIDEIQKGNLPVQTATNVVTQRNEVIHWGEPASLLEERVVARRYTGGSSGFSFRIAKGISYRVGGSRGRIITDTAIVPVSTGDLILSSKRIIFAGNAKSFSIKLDKILNFEFYRDGLQIHATTGKPRTIQIANADHIDIIGAIISTTVNGYGV